MAENYNFAVTMPSLKFTEFTPTQYKLDYADPKIPIQSMEKLAALEEKAYSTYTPVAQAYNKIRPYLNEAEYKWLDAKEKEVNDSIQAMIDAGNTESAAKYSRQAAIDFIRDKELQNKMQYEDSRNKFLTGLKSRNDINKDTQRAAILANTYNYTGSTEYIPKFDPESSVSVSDVAHRVNALVPEYSESKRTGGTNTVLVDDKGKPVSNPNDAFYKRGSVSSSNLDSWNEKDKDRLVRMFKNIIRSDSKINAGLKQQFDVSTILYKDAIKQLENTNLSEEDRKQWEAERDRHLSEITNDDGIIIDNYDKWIDTRVIPIIEDLHYKRKSTGRETSNIYSDDWIASTSAMREDKYNDEDDEDTSVTSNIVEKTYDFAGDWNKTKSWREAYSDINEQLTGKTQGNAAADASLFKN